MTLLLALRLIHRDCGGIVYCLFSLSITINRYEIGVFLQSVTKRTRWSRRLGLSLPSGKRTACVLYP